MAGTVDMGLEGAPLLSDLPYLRKRKHLETAAVREYRSVPRLKPVKSACRPEGLQTRTEIKMIGIAQDDFRVDVILEFLMVDTLDRPYRAHRHEDRGADLTMVSGDQAASGI